jgi:hypothetical protein
MISGENSIENRSQIEKSILINILNTNVSITDIINDKTIIPHTSSYLPAYRRRTTNASSISEYKIK